MDALGMELIPFPWIESVPLAQPLKAKIPAPLRLYTKVKLAAPRPGMTALAGIGPVGEIAPVPALPSFWKYVKTAYWFGTTLLAVARPVLDTVITKVTFSPVEAVVGKKAIQLFKLAGVLTEAEAKLLAEVMVKLEIWSVPWAKAVTE